MLIDVTVISFSISFVQKENKNIVNPKTSATTHLLMVPFDSISMCENICVLLIVRRL